MIQCPRCSCALLGPVLSADHESVRYACACCPYTLELEASAVDIAKYSNVVPFNPRERRAASGSR